jgi:hypothetical protein
VFAAVRRHESQSWEGAVLKSLQFARIGSGLVIGMLLQACGTLPRLDAVPPALTERAAISGIPNSRYWLDRDLAPWHKTPPGEATPEHH